MNYKKLLFWLIVFLPVYFWGDSFAWDLSRLNLYLLFPLLGMLAFSIMWTQVVVGTFKEKFENVNKFFSRTGVAVFLLFFFHPVLAAVAQFKSVGLLPLQSFFDLVGPAQKKFLIIGMIAFTIFVLYEIVLRVAALRKVQKLNKFFEIFSEFGIILVFIHSINLGSHLQAGFLKYVWWFYGVSAILMIGWKYFGKKHFRN